MVREFLLDRESGLNRNALVSVGLALLCAGCSLSTRPPSPGIPVTGNTAETPTLSPTPFPGSALFFDGQDDYVLVNDDPSLDLENSFTIAAWIYLESYRGWASLVTKGDKPNISNYAIQQSEPNDPLYGTIYGKLRFSGCVAFSTPLPESATVLPLQTWHFVAVTFDGAQVRFYLNGVQDGSGSLTGPLCTNDQPLYIGVDFPLTTEYWHGAIDELRIWNTTLSEGEILNVMHGRQTSPESGLVGYWAFDEGSGYIAHDQSGQANDGQVVGDPLWIRPAAPTP
jgi:hypothetical protein